MNSLKAFERGKVETAIKAQIDTETIPKHFSKKYSNYYGLKIIHLQKSIGKHKDN